MKDMKCFEIYIRFYILMFILYYVDRGIGRSETLKKVLSKVDNKCLMERSFLLAVEMKLSCFR